MKKRRLSKRLKCLSRVIMRRRKKKSKIQIMKIRSQSEARWKATWIVEKKVRGRQVWVCTDIWWYDQLVIQVKRAREEEDKQVKAKSANEKDGVNWWSRLSQSERVDKKWVRQKVSKVKDGQKVWYERAKEERGGSRQVFRGLSKKKKKAKSYKHKASSDSVKEDERGWEAGEEQCLSSRRREEQRERLRVNSAKATDSMIWLEQKDVRPFFVLTVKEKLHKRF
jgi:hypothetical protein